MRSLLRLHTEPPTRKANKEKLIVVPAWPASRCVRSPLRLHTQTPTKKANCGARLAGKPVCAFSAVLVQARSTT